MQHEDFILKIIESLSSFIKKLLKLNIDAEPEVFEQQANDLLHDFFGSDINDPESISREKLLNFMQKEHLQKPIMILFAKIAISKAKSELGIGRKYYDIVVRELLPHLKSVNAFESEEDITLKKLLSQCKELYKDNIQN